MSSEPDKRRAIAETAREYREGAARHGVHISPEQAQRRVAEAVRRGDRKRDNNHR